PRVGKVLTCWATGTGGFPRLQSAGIAGPRPRPHKTGPEEHGHSDRTNHPPGLQHRTTPTMSPTLQILDSPPGGLFWSAPLGVDSDFTAEDPLALDYLAQQVGLWLFRGFTTRTARAQNYAVVAYGLRLAEKAVDRYGYPGDDETRTRLFERWERFWALATL